jgi:hypothetical protein
VTTLITLVRKKIATRISSLLASTLSILTRLVGFISGMVVLNLEGQKVMDGGQYRGGHQTVGQWFRFSNARHKSNDEFGHRFPG